MDAMDNFKDTDMNQRAVLVFLSLLRIITTDKTEPVFTNTLLNIIENGSKYNPNIHSILEQSCSFLLDLIKMLSRACQLLIGKRGLEIIFLILNVSELFINE
jgi:hypothetical protein